ncbi:MAG: DegT/DnrJ/EryC1/StrS family aminotransferase [Hyphomicrobiales bacterium]
MGYVTVLPTATLRQFLIASPRYPVPNYLAPAQFYDYGRSALGVAVDLLGLPSNSEILMPATICEVVISTLVHKKLKIQYYNLTNNLDIDFDDLSRRVNPNTKAIYVNHFLGRASSLSEVRDFCNKNDIKLIEDCAHGLASEYEGQQLGSTGDVSIFSYRKFLPIPDGGGLVINDKKLMQNPTTLPNQNWQRQLISGIKLVGLRLAQMGILPISILKKLRGNTVETYIDGSDEINEINWSPPQNIQWLSRKAIEKSNIDFMREQRQINYLAWQKNLIFGDQMVPLFNQLQKGAVPYSFPILVERREQLIRSLAKHSIYLEPTLTNPPYFGLSKSEIALNSFDQITSITSRLLSLPVHQSISENDIKNMAVLINSAISNAEPLKIEYS